MKSFNIVEETYTGALEAYSISRLNTYNSFSEYYKLQYIEKNNLINYSESTVTGNLCYDALEDYYLRYKGKTYHSNDTLIKSLEEKLEHTIANLTLSGNNGNLSNKAFLEKRDMNSENKEQGYKYSRLWLNRYLNKIDRWGREEIEKRFYVIEERFLKIWKYPPALISFQ